MNWQLIPTVVLAKPALGKPCNSCGLCCIAEVCDLGKELGDEVRCRALLAHADGTFTCGLVADPYSVLPDDRLAPWRAIDRLAGEPSGEAALKAHFAGLLGAGRGCDSEDDVATEFLEEQEQNWQLSLALAGG
jgi:hypothetical protein